MKYKWMIILILIEELITQSHQQTSKPKGYERDICSFHHGKLIQPFTIHRKRLLDMRDQMMIRSSLQGPEIDAYILPSYDEHLNSEVADFDKRVPYITGFTGLEAIAVITQKGAALWTERRYLKQADGELDCDWEIYEKNCSISIPDWIESQLYPEKRVGADPRLVPNDMWLEWENELRDRDFQLVKVNNNLVDLIWGTERPPMSGYTTKVQHIRYAGVKWEEKIARLRHSLKNKHCDAMVVTSLPEIAYLLNIRGKDIPYTPVVKGYLVVSLNEIVFYTDQAKVDLGTRLQLKTHNCFNANCVILKDYDYIWGDLLTYSQVWKRVLVPAPCAFDKGASHAVYSIFPPHLVYKHISPVIFMKAVKNEVERKGMISSHIKDGAAICEAMCNLEQRFHQEKWTEMKIKFEVERSRISQSLSKGLSLRTVVAFGEHSSYPYYANSNVTDIEVTNENTLIIESGGQYFEGTTDVSRTYHFGEPTAEQKRAYTNVLSSILQLSHLKFPAHAPPSGIDALSRISVWNQMSDYPHATGHGIGSYLSVQEPPIDVSFSSGDKFPFREGYFFSNEPGFYKRGQFGIRLENVLEVVDTGSRHESGEKFLTFKEITLVPYEPKLIDRSLLSAPMKIQLNEYNAKIRDLVGNELKRQGNMNAFYWMMNKTEHVREYLPRDEYLSSSQVPLYSTTVVFLMLAISQISRLIL